MDTLIHEWLKELPLDLREEFEERAGIMEFDGGMSRECAEFASMAVLFRRHSPRSHGLHLSRGEDSRYFLTTDLERVPTRGVRELDLGGLREVVAGLGGVVLLVAPEK